MNLQNEEVMTLPIETDILMIGHFARDILVVDGRAEISSGGGVYYGGIVLCRLGLRMAVVTRLHPESRVIEDAAVTKKRAGPRSYSDGGPCRVTHGHIFRSEDRARTGPDS